jgi:hypothetical protein
MRTRCNFHRWVLMTSSRRRVFGQIVWRARWWTCADCGAETEE